MSLHSPLYRPYFGGYLGIALGLKSALYRLATHSPYTPMRVNPPWRRDTHAYQRRYSATGGGGSKSSGHGLRTGRDAHLC